jgi:hypothetical protein
MAAIENEKVYALKIRESADDGSDFGTPDADYRFLFLGEDGDLHLKDAADAVTDVGAAAPASFAGARAQSNADTTVNHNTWTRVALATETYDTASFHGSSGTFTAAATGYFRCTAMVSWRNSATAGIKYASFYKNGSAYGTTSGAGPGNNSDGFPTHALVDTIPVVANDTIELYAYVNIGGANLNVYNAQMVVEFIPA